MNLILIDPFDPIKNGVLWEKNYGFLKLEQRIKLLEYLSLFQRPRLKKFGKIRLGSKLSLGLIDGLSFRIQTASYFPQSWVKKTALYNIWGIFHDWNWLIPGFDENKTQHWALISTKTNQGRFYFHWVQLLSRA